MHDAAAPHVPPLVVLVQAKGSCAVVALLLEELLVRDVVRAAAAVAAATAEHNAGPKEEENEAQEADGAQHNARDGGRQDVLCGVTGCEMKKKERKGA